MLPEITSWEIILEKILSMRVFEGLVILAGCKIYGIKKFEARESETKLKSETSILGCLWKQPTMILLFLEFIISIKIPADLIYLG